jgi:predicted NAD/FAD-binding protein
MKDQESVGPPASQPAHEEVVEVLVWPPPKHDDVACETSLPGSVPPTIPEEQLPCSPKSIQSEQEAMSDPGGEAPEHRWKRYANHALKPLSFLILFVLSILLGILSISFWWKGSIDMGAHLTAIVALILVTLIPCCRSCCCDCCFFCCKERLRESSLELSASWRCVLISAPITSWIVLVAVFMNLFHADFTPVLNTAFDPSQPVAVVGSGPSGLTAAWALAKSGRQVVLVEALSDIGGHSKTWDETMPDGRTSSYDVGFIFNNIHYNSYKGIAQYLNYSLTDTSLNVSGAWNNRYWDNTNTQRGIYPDELENDIDKFEEFVQQPETIGRFLMPLGTFLWWHGFSEAFLKLCLDSTMTVLFVTKMGLLRQSSQAVLNYFAWDGFTHLRASPPKVSNNLKGSQHMWRAFLEDMTSTGRVQVHLDSEVIGMRHDNSLWSLQLSHGKELTGFGDVVLALPADVQGKLLHNPLQQLVLSQIEYVSTYLSLHTHASATVGSAAFAPANEHVVYYVDDVSMTGKISKIFNNPSSDLLLTVHDDKDLIPQSKVKVQYHWSHHYVSLWELAIARRIVPLFNPTNRVHLAGDWLYGVGHDDAIISGFLAACSVGMPKSLPDSEDSRAQRLHQELIKRICTPKEAK